VRDLVSNNTGYATDVDDTDAETQENVTVQDPSGESDLSGVLSPAATTPVIVTNGGVKPAQTCFTREGENADRAESITGSDASYSDGTAERLDEDGSVDGPTAFAEYDFTLNYTVPADEWDFAVRHNTKNQGGPELRWILQHANGNSYTLADTGLGFSFQNVRFDQLGDTIFDDYTGPDLTSGDYTLRCVVDNTDASIGTYIYDIDVIAPHDNRYQYTFDNTVDVNGYLDGPELYPPSVDAVFDAYRSAFSITGGDVTATLTDTSNNQALALSNDFGSTYPISGSNTTSVGGDFASPGAALNLKATLSRYSPSGAQSATPRFGYDAQRLDGYTLQADISFEALLIDDKFDNNLTDVLNDIARDQYIWSYQIQGGTPTLAWTEREQRIGSDDPELEDAQITKQGETWDSVTIKASNVPVSNEQFTASASFVDLAESDLQTGSESVYDGGTNAQFERGTDYEMDYSNGEIRILSGGGMTGGTDYLIDYRHEVKGTHTVTSPPDRELVETVPGIVSDRQAEQIAYVVAEVEPEVNTPRYEGQLIVPSVDARFDPLEALPLDNLDLPDVATPLSIGGQPEVTPRGLVFNVGSAPPLESQLSGIRDRVQKVSDRV